VTAVQTESQQPANAITVRPFRLLWLNNVSFFLVSNAQRFVFGWLVLDGMNRSESDQGIVVFTLGLPAALLVLQAGAWADRWDRRRMLIWTQVTGGAVMAATALLVRADTISFGWVIVMTLFAGAASAIGQPVRSSLIPVLVAKEQLFSAIAVNAIAMTLSLILGPVLAKVVGDQYGFDGAFWFQAGLMFAGVIFLLRLEVPPHVDLRPKRPIIADMKEALRHVLGDANLRVLFGLLVMASLTVNPAIMVTLQAHVKDGLGRTAGDAALPFALMGIGIAISSVVVMRKGDMKQKGAAFQRALICGSTITILTGRTTDFWQVLVLAFFMGLAGGFYINMNQGLIQANTPQPLMGRVMGLYALTSFGIMPFGALILGAIATWTSTGAAISGAALISLIGVVTTYVSQRGLRELS
jgi:MFS family permease|tara:strand:- start:7973 stop:9208 length:1236 start_codon:yes stop_codon:yes gene_type:complete